MKNEYVGDPLVIFEIEGTRSCFNESKYPPRGTTQARYAVCLLRDENDNENVVFVRGIGILYPDIDHLYFAEEKSSSPEKFWRSMYAASKTSRLNVSVHSAQMAMLIADETIPLDDSRFHSMESCIGYDYSLETFRADVFAQKIPKDDLEKIAEGFKSSGAELEVS